MNSPFNPDTLERPRGPYSQGVEVPAGSRLVFVAGQGGFMANGQLPATLAGQAEQALINLLCVVKGAGMSAADIVSLTTYIVSDAQGAELMTPLSVVREKVLGNVRPASTAIVVKGFADPEMLVEIECIAAKA